MAAYGVGLLAGFWDGISWLASYAIPFLFVLTLVVFFHELGHFLAARWCGIKVEAFSIGFGRSLLSWTDRKGTVWKIGWLPLGGYVKFLGDLDATSRPDRHKLSHLLALTPDEDTFHNKPLRQRAFVVAAGPLANFLLAIVIFTLLFAIIGEPHIAARIGAVMPGSAAEKAGFKPDDVVVEINGRTIDNFLDLQEITLVSAGRPLTIEVERGGQRVTLNAVPSAEEVRDRFGNVTRVGRLGLKPSAQPTEANYVRYDPFTALVKAVDRTLFVISHTLAYVRDLIFGREDATQLSGPLGIAGMSKEAAQAGPVNLFNLVALLSISIGLLNLFPVPMLDGGHLLFYGFEAIRGRPLGERAQEFGFRIGLAFVLFLMILATWNDISRLPIFG